MSGAPGPNVIRLCKRCGDPYHPKSTRQQCCNKPIKVPCVVCGKLMDQVCTFARQNTTCSKECSTILANQSRESSAQQLIRTCKWCGKKFHPKTVRDLYCDGPHYAVCTICGKEFEITGRIDVHNRTCSESCRYISAKRNTDMTVMAANIKTTMLERYGVENAMHIPGVVDKLKATTKKRYGSEWYTQTKEYREQTKQTCLAKYGVEHHLAAPTVKEKRKNTLRTRYNVDNVFQSNVVKEQTKHTNLGKYGVEYISQSPEIHRRMYVNRVNNMAIDGKLFDSSYECLFYNFLLKLSGVTISTQVPLSYIYKNNPHTTLIDFKVNDIYFEVKGSHLLTGVFSGGTQIPITTKLDVYRNNHVVVVTDAAVSVDSLFDNGLLGIDISIFEDTQHAPQQIWTHVIEHIEHGRGLLHKSDIF